MKENELAYRRKDIPGEENRGKARQIFDRYKAHLAIGGLSLLLLGGAAGCSGCSRPAKEYMQKIEEHKKIELSPEEQEKLNFDLIEIVLRTGGKDAALIAAYLEKGADPNAIDAMGRGPAIVRVARMGDLKTLKLMLEKGGDVNARDSDGNTSLIEASDSMYDSAKKVELLLEKGAEVDAKSEDGDTALMNAALVGNTGVMELLIEAGADVNARDNEGRSALMMACSPFGSKEAVELLLQKGANVNAVDNSGMSVLDHYNKYCRSVVELLAAQNNKE